MKRLAQCIALAAVVSPEICSADLVGYWPFDTSAPLGKDLSGNNYTLTAVGAQYNSAGKRGGAVSLNGTSNYLLGNLAKLPVANSPYTLSAWFKPTATGARGLMGWGSWGTTRAVVALRLDGTNGFSHYWWGADLGANAPTNYSDGAWHHLAATYDGTLRSLYMDGILLAQDNPGSHAATNTNFRIGSTNSGEFFKGFLDEVALWNHALSAGEIEGLAGGGVPVGGPKITAFTATPATAYEGGAVQLAWTVDVAAITGSYSYQLKQGAAVLASGTALTGSYGIVVPDLAGVRQDLNYTLTATETGGGNIANSLGVKVVADPGRPLAAGQPFLATAGTSPLALVLEGSDPNGGALSYRIATPPAKGTLSGTPPRLTYTADANASGVDSFTFVASDGKYESEPARVSIAVKAPPAPPTSLELDALTVLESRAAGSFLAMISSADPNEGEARRFELASGEGDGDNAKFAVEGFQLRAAQSLAGLAGKSLQLRLRTVDAGGFSLERAFVLQVLAPAPGVVINEIHFNGADNTVLNEFVELYNAGVSPVALTGWRLSGGVDYAFPSGTSLEPGAYLLVAESPAVILSKFSKAALGPWVGSLNSEGETLRLRDQVDQVVDQVDYAVGFPWPVAAGGDGTSLEKIHPLLDGGLGGSWRSAAIPADNALIDIASPGAVNRQFAASPPPASRQVAHFPQQPTSQDAIVITAKVTDPDGVAAVSLSYQVVLPGSYIPRYLSNIPTATNIAVEARKLNPAYELEANWTTVAMADDGLQRDARGGDSVFTAVLPPQGHRSLVRYRITVSDGQGNRVRIPYADDPAANFACYIYDGVPAYGTTSAAALQTLPVYQLLTKQSDWIDCMAYDGNKQLAQGMQSRFYYNWNGTFIYNGVAYDNITYRTRGANGRYLGAGKRSMRYKFHRGSYLDVRDQQGKPYAQKWQTLTTNKGIENHGSLTYGLNESMNFRMWNAYGAPAPYAHFAHWRNVTTAAEQADPYHGDFQGLTFVQEDYDARFLDAHGMAKGNLYKLLNQTNVPLEQQRYQAPLAPKNGSDHNWIEGTLAGSTPAATVAANVNLDQWNRYHAICQAVRHYDYWPDANKNMAYYFEPVYTTLNGNRGKLWILPFDTDASWGPTWNNGEDAVYNALFSCSTGGGDSFSNPTLWPAYFNAVREVRDLLFQPDQLNALIEETAAVVAPLVPADLARWKSAPADVGNYSGISGPGMTSLAALVQDLKNFAFVGGSWAGGSVGTGGRASFMETFQGSLGEGSKIPGKPVLTYRGGATYPVNDLRFSCSNFLDPQGVESFAAMRWRLAEVTDPTAPSHVAGAPFKLEIAAGYDSGEIAAYASEFRFPARAALPGHSYRARVRLKDNTGRWSRWSSPVQFTARAADLAVYQQSLVVTELMYHPLPPSAAEVLQGWAEEDFEYLELRNVGTAVADLSDLRFTKGINFDFAPGYPLAPGASALVVRNAAAFASRYGAGRPIAGLWQAGDFLSNGGEEVKLSYGAGTEVLAFTYNDKAPWPVSSDGSGDSAVLRFPGQGGLDLSDGRNWRRSAAAGGSPGGDDRETLATWAARQGLSGDPLGDSDRDGLLDLVEFMMGTDPAAAASRPAPVAASADFDVAGAVGRYPTLTLERSDVPGYACAVDFSADLASWALPGVLVSAEVLEDGRRREVWRAPVASPTRLYGRVRVAAP